MQSRLVANIASHRLLPRDEQVPHERVPIRDIFGISPLVGVPFTPHRGPYFVGIYGPDFVVLTHEPQRPEPSSSLFTTLLNSTAWMHTRKLHRSTHHTSYICTLGSVARYHSVCGSGSPAI